MAHQYLMGFAVEPALLLCGPGIRAHLTALPAERRDAIDAQFIRVFAGEGSADDVRELATHYGCRVTVVTPADGAWTRDPFASSPLYRLVEAEPGRWRIYRATGGDAFRQ